MARSGCAIPFNIPAERETRIFLASGGEPPEAPASREIVFAGVNQYTIQAQLFADAILNDTEVPVPPSDAVKNMRVIDEILGS